MIHLFLFIAINFGLFELQGFSVRTVGLVGLIVVCCFKIKSNYFYFINAFLFSIFLILYSYLYISNEIRFTSTFLLHTRNLIVLFVFFGMLYKSNLDFAGFLHALSLFIVSCAFINLLIIAFYKQPWVVIAEYTGTNEEFFAHLYHRLILPFGTPNQLGFVAGLLILYNFSLKNVKICLLLFIPLMGAASNSSLIPLTLIFLFYFLYKMMNQKRFVIKRNNILTLGIISCISFIAFLVFFDGTSPGGVGGRSAENMNESIGRHLFLRLNTLEAISQFPLPQFFYGVGFGNSHQYIGGTYSFTIPLTTLFESGVFGLYFYYILPFLFVLKFRNIKWVSFIIFYVFIASLLYQLNSDISFYILPLIIAYQLQRNSNENNLSL
ncbi:hypothetical protein [Pseudoalteromonas atlantica]|uniref:hypothetical protein n=1 Tax=Pseudoalteromonas atlantica TaxID=288 RepID=UPI0037357A1B